MHALVYMTAYPTATCWLLQYVTASTWTTPFDSVGIAIFSTGNGKWGPVGNQQTNTLPTSVSGYVPVNAWTLLSYTVDGTVSTNNVKLYKNGQLVGTGNQAATTLSLGSSGYWSQHPNTNSGDSGDGAFPGLIAMTRFDGTLRSQAYIQAMWQSIFPQAANWPVP